MFLPCQQHTTYSPATIAHQVFSLTSVLTCSVPNSTSVAMVSPFLGLFYIAIWLLGCLT